GRPARSSPASPPPRSSCTPWSSSRGWAGRGRRPIAEPPLSRRSSSGSPAATTRTCCSSPRWSGTWRGSSTRPRSGRGSSWPACPSTGAPAPPRRPGARPSAATACSGTGRATRAAERGRPGAAPRESAMGWIGYAAWSAVLAGLVAIFGKIGVSGVDNVTATTIRAAIMFGALLAVTAARGGLGGAALPDRRALLYIALSGLAGAGSWLCYFRALQLGDALRVAPIDRLSGGVTLVLAALLLHERAPLSAWVGT